MGAEWESWGSDEGLFGSCMGAEWRAGVLNGSCLGSHAGVISKV